MKRENDFVIDVRGCVILPNGNLLMTNYSKQNQLVEYKYTGEHMRDIQVSALPFFIAVIDPNRIAVTYGDTAKFMEIRNTHSFRAEKEIRLLSNGYGVSHEDGLVSNNLTIIQQDGKDSKTLLTESDGLFYPQTVDFDMDKRTLLICNKGGKVSMYKVV
ncbi:Hypothetical predicted protein [Mytilus galloprovincialis]|uniref:Uncharacterized protein n=1 Tax=Mytilus galloprovincialis TaxID=29158 RepID=A0A8B6GZE8_MYTGA|nr:Hypothetical predicted protein [Mytilus galloprovincialis]